MYLTRYILDILLWALCTCHVSQHYRNSRLLLKRKVSRVPAGPDALSGSAPVPGSTTNGSEPIIPASGLSISDYYNDDHANDDLSKDVSPQIPGNTSHSGPTSSTNMASPLPLPAVNPAALNSTEPLGTEQTADQPVQDVSNKAAAPTAVTATSTTGPRPGTVTLPLDTPPAPAKADAAPTQSAWQQSSSPQPSSSSTAAAAAVDVVATSSENLFGTTWQSAPACQAQPNKQNSVQVLWHSALTAAVHCAIPLQADRA